jgi:hypothetical protein
MNCSSCGLQLPPGAANCPRCGAATPYNYSAAGTAPDDPTYISTPYAAPPYGTVPPTQYAGMPQDAALPTQQAGPPQDGALPTQYGGSPYQAPPQAPSGSQPYAEIPQNPYSQNPYSTPSYAPYGGAPPTPVPPIQPKRPGNRIGIIVGVVVLVLILIGGGVFALLSRSGSKPAPTPVVNGTPSASNATVPTAAGTAVVSSQDPYTHSGTLTFSDPVSDNSKGYGWDVNSNCAFTGGTYHAIAPDANYADYCLAEATNLGDFVMEAQMQVVKGDGGGIVFRVTSTNPNNEYYEFIIGQDGSYDLYLVTGNSASDSKTLTSGSNPAITQSLNQTNLIAIGAKGNTIMLYVNHQPIARMTDSTYTGGKIGFVAYPNTKPTEVAFSNLKVWRL